MKAFDCTVKYKNCRGQDNRPSGVGRPHHSRQVASASAIVVEIAINEIHTLLQTPS